MLAWVKVWGKALGGRLGILTFALAPCASGCIDDFDNPKGYGTGYNGNGNGTSYDCIDLCEDSTNCDGSSSDDDCDQQCDLLEDIVRSAGCSDELEDAYDCFSGASNACSAQEDECLDETNDVSRCIEDYCSVDWERCTDY